MNNKIFLVAIFYLFAGLLAAVLQTSLFPRLGLTALAPSLTCIIIISLPTIFPVWLGTIIAVGLGIIADAIMLTSTGFHTLGFLVIFYLLVYLRQTIFFDRLPFQALMAGLAHLILFNVIQFIMANPDSGYQNFHLLPGVSSALVTALVAIPILYGLQPLSRLTSGHKRLTTSP